DHQDADAVLAVDALEQPEDLLEYHRREADRRLVEQHETRPRHQRSRNGELALLAAAQHAAKLQATSTERGKPLQHLCDAATHLAQIAEQIAPADLEILLDRHARQDDVLRRHIADAQARQRESGPALEAVAQLAVVELD